MGSTETAFVGRFSFLLVPFFRWLLTERYPDPAVRKIVVRKSAQVGWTQSVICNLMGYFAHVERSTCVAMFPKEGSARQFDREKFGPMVESTPELAALIPVKSRVKDQTALYKSFPGGFVKLVGSNSIADVKSTSARRLIVEEPDDCNLNLRGQGDSIKLIEERGKGYRDVKILIGGTPSVKGVSSIDDEFERSDRNEWHVPCPDCGTLQALEWEQVTWTHDETRSHPVFGTAVTESARYRCVDPECGALWTDAQKNASVQLGKPVATAPFNGTVGLTLNELYSSLHASRMQFLVERYVEAKGESEQGKPESLITFWNAALGRAWEHVGDGPKVDALEERALSYEEQTVPAGGLLLTAGVDFQHDRIAIIVRAWGRGEESWLVLWTEIEGAVLDRTSEVWDALDGFLYGRYRHASGAELPITAVSLDSGDGQTSEQVYDYVRKRSRRRGPRLMAIKGSSTPGREIYTRPAPVDPSKNTKAAKRGLQVYQVGTERAKDLILESRLRLLGGGPGRFHFYAGVRSDYYEQLTAEVKVPRRDRRGSKVWQKKTGARNEALDGEIYALHASRAVRVHLFREEQWALAEKRIGLVKAPEGAPSLPVASIPVGNSAPEEPTSEKSGTQAAIAPAKDEKPRRKVLRPRRNFATNW